MNMKLWFKLQWIEDLDCNRSWLMRSNAFVEWSSASISSCYPGAN